MKRILTAAALVLGLANSAHATSLDLADNSFGSVTHGFAGPIVEFTEVAAGVTFTFDAGGQFRNVGTWSNGTTNVNPPWALSFGGGGGNTANFTLTASANVTLTSFSGFAQQFNTGAIFDVTGTGVSSTGNAFSTAAFLSSGTPLAESFVGGPLNLLAGEIYTFTTTNNSASTLSHLTSLEFTAAPIPLPAGAPLLIAGLGAFAWVKRRRS